MFTKLNQLAIHNVTQKNNDNASFQEGVLICNTLFEKNKQPRFALMRPGQINFTDFFLLHLLYQSV